MPRVLAVEGGDDGDELMRAFRVLSEPEAQARERAELAVVLQVCFPLEDSTQGLSRRRLRVCESFS